MAQLVKQAAPSETIAYLVKSLRDKWRGLVMKGGPNKDVSVLAQMLAGPVRAVRNTGNTILFGRKAMSGPFAGKRLHPVHGKRGVIPIGRAEHAAISEGRLAGEAYRVKAKDGDLFFKRRYDRGGMVGFAKNHPLATLGIAGGSYLLATNPAVREVIPRPRKNEVSPYVQNTFSQPVSGENPMARNVWG